MRRYGLKVVELTGSLGSPVPTACAGQWVSYYDATAFAGRGEVETTADPARALVFASVSEAFAFWRQVPKNRPRRADGRPNRPLTAFTISIEEVEG